MQVTREIEYFLERLFFQWHFYCFVLKKMNDISLIMNCGIPFKLALAKLDVSGKLLS